MPLLVAAVGSGAWSLPQNDDWDYARSALALHDAGIVVFTGWSSPTLIGQVVLAQPLLAISDSVGALHAFGFLSACVLVIATWFVARAVVGRRSAALVAGITAFAPLVGILATTFMTDVPSAALQALCLYLGTRALRAGSQRGRRSWLVGALFAGIVACAIRETAVTAPLALGLVTLWTWRHGRRPDWFVIGTGAAFAAAFLAVVLWRQQQPNVQLFGTAAASIGNLQTMPGAVAAIALAMLPLLLVLPWQRLLLDGRGSLLRVVLAGAAAVAIAVWLLPGAAEGALLPGNILAPDGPTSSQVLSGPRPFLISADLWNGLELLSVAGSALLAAALVAGVVKALQRQSSLNSIDALLAVNTIVVLVGIGVASASLVGAFDRYAIPLLASLPLLALRLSGQPPAAQSNTGDSRRWLTAASRASAAAVATLGVGGLFALTFVLSAGGDAYDAARWQAGTSLVADGVAAERVDAGFEWVGWHAALPLHPSGASPGSMPFYEGLLGASSPCSIVSNITAPPDDPGHTFGSPYAVAQWGDVGGTEHQLFAFAVNPC